MRCIASFEEKRFWWISDKMMLRRTGKSKISYRKTLPFFMAIYPILNVYSIGPLPAGDLVALFLVMSFYIKHNNNTSPNRSNAVRFYRFFIIYIIVSLPILVLTKSNVDFFEIFTKSFHLLLYSYFAFVIGRSVNLNVLSELVIKITKICSFIILIQQGVSLLFGVHTYLLLPFLRLNYTYKSYSQYLEVYNASLRFQGYRPSAFFLEPSHACMYITLGLVLLLCYSKKTKKDYINILMILLAMICTYSTGGILGAAVCIVYYTIVFNKEKTSSEKMFKAFLILASVAGAYIIISSNARVLTTIIGRIGSIGSTAYNSTGNIRVLRGYYVWQQLPLLNKVFGTGIGCLLQDITDNNIIVLMDTTFMDDMNAIFCVLSTFGIIGFFLYFVSIIRNCFRCGHLRRMLCVAYIFSCAYSNWLYHSIIILYYVFIFMNFESAKIGNWNEKTTH